MKVGLVELRVPPRLEFLQVIRAFVGAVALVSSDLTAQRASDLRLAVSEAASNGMKAQFRLGAKDEILICCNLDHRQVEVEVRDHGGGFDPKAIKAVPDIESPQRLHYESGLGIALMRRLADEVVIETTPEGTAVRLIMELDNFETEL